MTCLVPTNDKPPITIYWSRYSRGTSIDICSWSIEREIITIGADLLKDQPIIGKTVFEANVEMAKRFIESKTNYLLHADDDQYLPKGSLEAMVNTLKMGQSDIVTLPACNRGHEKKAVEYGGPGGKYDNHRVDPYGRTTWFAIAVMLSNRKVFETLRPDLNWQATCKVRSLGDNGSGENWFSQSVLEHPELKHKMLPIVSPHAEITEFKGIHSDKGNAGHSRQHGIRWYPDPSWFERNQPDFMVTREELGLISV